MQREVSNKLILKSIIVLIIDYIIIEAAMIIFCQIKFFIRIMILICILKAMQVTIIKKIYEKSHF
jgi:hypothetical protein